MPDYQHRQVKRWEGSMFWEDVWFLDEGDVWLVQCMDCGIRIGTVNNGNEQGARRLTEDHNGRMHKG